MLYMVETQVYLDLVPNKSIDQLGAKSCIIWTRGAEKKHITLLNVSTNGYCKGKQNLKLRVPEEILVHVQSKTRMDEELMKDNIEHVWQPYMKKTAEQLGLPDSNSLDCFCVHTTEQIE